MSSRFDPKRFHKADSPFSGDSSTVTSSGRRSRYSFWAFWIVGLLLLVDCVVNFIHSRAAMQLRCSDLSPKTEECKCDDISSSKAGLKGVEVQSMETAPLVDMADRKGIVLLPASVDKFGIAAVLGSSALFDLHGWYPVIMLNEASRLSPGLESYIADHRLCCVPVKHPEYPQEDPPNSPATSSYLRYQRLLVAPYLVTLMEKTCAVTGVRNDTFVVLGDADLWPVNDAFLVGLKLEWELSKKPKSIVMQGPEVKPWPWRRRAMCYTGGTIEGWRQYMNSSGDVFTDWKHHLEVARMLRSKLNRTWLARTPLSHMDEFIMGNRLLMEKSYPVVEHDVKPRRVGKHFNESWIYDERGVSEHIFEKDDIHLGHLLKPKALMSYMLRMALNEEDVQRYWSIYDAAPVLEESDFHEEGT